MVRARNGQVPSELEAVEGAENPKESFKIFKTERLVAKYDIYLSNDIVSPHVYDELSHTIRNAEEDSEVNLYLTSSGGDMETGLGLVQAIRDSAATVKTILNPQGYSMGALLFLSGDIKLAPPNSILMFHHYSGDVSGKGHEQVAELAATNEWFEGVMQDICYPFLSKKEIKEILQGKDLWLQYTDIQKRLARLSV